ncbi:hypothetical protein B9Z19DRAFT_393613 [Tuber borchii]|uniref:Uncharacterized protein n=1 Tax=Tuber borchii TaxID=42251 RepID=A0A2T6ZHB0_TUBBO|nr:hypothetical protein B9Z19DRAFT_393613 [Tuber borchii]
MDRWVGWIDRCGVWVEKVKFVIPHPVVNHDESTVQRGFEGCVWCLSVREDERGKESGHFSRVGYWYRRVRSANRERFQFQLKTSPTIHSLHSSDYPPTPSPKSLDSTSPKPHPPPPTPHNLCITTMRNESHITVPTIPQRQTQQTNPTINHAFLAKTLQSRPPLHAIHHNSAPARAGTATINVSPPQCATPCLLACLLTATD